MSTEKILQDRGKNYGSFEGNASIAQELKKLWWASDGRGRLLSEACTSAVINEGIEMILHKLARIMNGDPYYADSYQDIAGYAQLIVNHLNKNYNATVDINKGKAGCYDNLELNKQYDYPNRMTHFNCPEEKRVIEGSKL